MIAYILGALLTFLGLSNSQADVIPPMSTYAPSVIAYEDDELDWFVYNLEAQTEYAAEFTALFNSYETKWSKNNRLMMKKPGDKSFKFVAKA